MESRDLMLESFISNYGKNRSQEDDDHLRQCWRIQDCGHCIVSKHVCAWCPYSGTCVPLPYRGNLLSPIHDAHICPVCHAPAFLRPRLTYLHLPWQERWELRTKLFGCNCSTTTFLAALITCLSTLVSLFILWGLWKSLQAIWLSIRAPRGGWQIDVVQDRDGEHWKEGIWDRRRPGIISRIKNGWTKKGHSEAAKGNDPNILVIEERRPLLEQGH